MFVRVSLILGMAVSSVAVSSCAGDMGLTSQEPIETDAMVLDVPARTFTSEPTGLPIQPIFTPTQNPTIALERVQTGDLVNLFPSSEVFASDNGDVAVINSSTECILRVK